MKNLSELLSTFEHTVVSERSLNPKISSLAFDSRAVKGGSLFFALPGTHTTGNVFIPQAIKNGAAAVIFQGEIDGGILEENKGVAFVRVEDARFVMAPVSAAFFDNPSKKLCVIGVTGTEGKSSTVSFIWQLLRLTGHKAGFISTVQFSNGSDAVDNSEHQTTPEAPIIQSRLAEMVKNGCEYAVIESSSHGLSPKTNRTGCIDYDCGIFMNVTMEHLEFHKTFEQYRFDKANLFRKLDECDHEKIINGEKRSVPSFAIVNLEDESAHYFIQATKKPVIGFTTEGKAGKQAAESVNAKPLPPIPEEIPVLVGRNIASARFGLTFDMAEPNMVDAQSRPVHKVIHVKAPVPGAFNAYNLMASIAAVSRLTGTSTEEVAAKTQELVCVRGRMSVVDKGQPFELIIDYAHTPSSFETIFPPLRRRCKGKMIALFGSGGERDIKKRPLQGEIAAKFCDIIILADEDPRGEVPEELLGQIAAGAEKEGKKLGENLFITPDRPTAIRQAFKMAGQDDIVLLLGKGHENSIIYKDHVLPYDERNEAEKALAEMGYLTESDS